MAQEDAGWIDVSKGFPKHCAQVELLINGQIVSAVYLEDLNDPIEGFVVPIVDFSPHLITCWRYANHGAAPAG